MLEREHNGHALPPCKDYVRGRYAGLRARFRPLQNLSCVSRSEPTMPRRLSPRTKWNLGADLRVAGGVQTRLVPRGQHRWRAGRPAGPRVPRGRPGGRPCARPRPWPPWHSQPAGAPSPPLGPLRFKKVSAAPNGHAPLENNCIACPHFLRCDKAVGKPTQRIRALPPPKINPVSGTTQLENSLSIYTKEAINLPKIILTRGTKKKAVLEDRAGCSQSLL